MTASKDWRRLADHVYARRDALGLTQDGVRAAGGPSTATLRLIEGALQTSYKRRILSSLERALQWKTGSVEAILAGGEPMPIEAEAPEAPEAESTLTPEELRLIERLRTDPAARQRFFDAILAGHGHPSGTTESDPDEHQGQRRYG